METKVIMWVQTDDSYKKHLWDLCAIAEIGAGEWLIPVKRFYRSNEIPHSQYNVVVGSVDECSSYLDQNGYAVPPPIDMIGLSSVSGRRFRVESKDNFLERYTSYPYFIKPYDIHKEFPAFVAKDKEDVL